MVNFNKILSAAIKSDAFIPYISKELKYVRNYYRPRQILSLIF